MKTLKYYSFCFAQQQKIPKIMYSCLYWRSFVSFHCLGLAMVTIRNLQGYRKICLCWVVVALTLSTPPPFIAFNNFLRPELLKCAACYTPHLRATRTRRVFPSMVQIPSGVIATYVFCARAPRLVRQQSASARSRLSGQ